MLIESSFCCSIERSSFNVSTCESRIAAYDWVSCAETRQMFHKLPGYSQGILPEAVSITDEQALLEPGPPGHSNYQTTCPEQLITSKTSGNALNSLVYTRRKQRANCKCTFTEHDPGESKRSGDQIDDPLVYSQREVKSSGTSTEHNCGTNNKSADRQFNSLVYSRRRQGVNSNGTFTERGLGKTNRSGVQIYDFLVYRRRKQRAESGGKSNEHDPGKTKRSGDLLDKSLVYSRKKRRLKSDGTFAECGPGKTNISGDQLGFLVYSQRKQRVESTGTRQTKKCWDRSNDSIVYSRRKQRVESTGTRQTKRCWDRPNDSIVYSRRKQRLKSTLTENDPGGTKRNGDKLDGLLVYSRRRLKAECSGTFTEHCSGKAKRSGDHLSFISSGAAALLAEKSQHCVCRVEPDIRNLVTHSRVSNRETDASIPVTEVACVSDRRAETCIHKTRQAECISGSCVSLKSSSELALLAIQTGAEKARECSSCGAMVAENITKGISAKDFCISVLRSNGLLSGTWPASTSSYVEEETDIDDSSTSSSLCKICGQSGTARKMLICDKCEEAFHTSCCGVRVKKVPENDEWFCPSCLKTKRKIFKETTTRRRGRNMASRTGVNPIALMLRDTKPYTSGVRIGKNFQAKVPDWSGPTTSDTSLVGEPLEFDPSQHMHAFKTNCPKKLSSLGNWLQCREEGVDGDICGKWRRAPLSEVQTDDWECFCCVFWDPAHADCSVPQELETNKILQQLKRIGKLRPRSDAKRRKAPKVVAAEHRTGQVSV